MSIAKAIIFIPNGKEPLERVIRRTVRRAVSDLLPDQKFLAAVREALPPIGIEIEMETLDADYWRIASELEMLTSSESSICADDAPCLSAFGQILYESIRATLRGG